MMIYNVNKIQSVPLFRDKDFANAETASLEFVCTDLPSHSDHVPGVTCQLLHDERNIYGLFTCKDNYVKAVMTDYQQCPCYDSCVEFFFKPDAGPGYFNLEMSAGSAFLLYYVIDPARTDHGLKDFVSVPREIANLITVKTNMPHIIEPEIKAPTTWQAMFTIPLEALEEYTGPLGNLSGHTWNGNFYKCGDKTSMPHWLSWAPLTATNFHVPSEFQTLKFL